MELVISPGPLQYLVPPYVEAIAKAHGWPSVRYKSRHSGGFDLKTPSLLLIYVAGDKVKPPVPYDRWVNFTLPADTGEQALNPLPQAALPCTADLRHEAAQPHAYPRNLSVIGVDRGGTALQPRTCFQRFCAQN